MAEVTTDVRFENMHRLVQIPISTHFYIYIYKYASVSVNLPA